MIDIALVLLAAYLVGSIPTGYLFSRYFFGIDVTRHGSGNIGATNVARVLGAKYFFLIFIIDACKAYLLLYVSSMLLQQHGSGSFPIDWVLYLSAALLLVGNAYSVFLHFTGGKGVATMCGVLYYIFTPAMFMWFALYWAFLLMLTKKAYIASVGATLSLLVTYVVLYWEATHYNIYFLSWLLCWIVWRHKSNIRRELV